MPAPVIEGVLREADTVPLAMALVHLTRDMSILDEIARELTIFIWAHPSVKSWYRNGKGRVVINQPWRPLDYWTMTRAPPPDDYVLA